MQTYAHVCLRMLTRSSIAPAIWTFLAQALCSLELLAMLRMLTCADVMLTYAAACAAGYACIVFEEAVAVEKSAVRALGVLTLLALPVQGTNTDTCVAAAPALILAKAVCC